MELAVVGPNAGALRQRFEADGWIVHELSEDLLVWRNITAFRRRDTVLLEYGPQEWPEDIRVELDRRIAKAAAALMSYGMQYLVLVGREWQALYTDEVNTGMPVIYAG